MRAKLNIAFDLGGVLFNWKPEKLLESLYSDHSTRTQIMQLVYQSQDWADLDRGILNQESAIERFATHTQLPHTQIRALIQATQQSLTPMDASWDLVKELYANHVPLYVISNMPINTYHYLQAHYDRWHYFKGVVISAEIGVVKPQPAIFEYLLQRYALQAGETLFIDDALDNVTAARATGLQTIHFTEIGHCRQQIFELLS